MFVFRLSLWREETLKSHKTWHFLLIVPLLSFIQIPKPDAQVQQTLCAQPSTHRKVSDADSEPDVISTENGVELSPLGRYQVNGHDAIHYNDYFVNVLYSYKEEFHYVESMYNVQAFNESHLTQNWSC